MNGSKQIAGTKLGNVGCNRLVRRRPAPSFGRGKKRIKTFRVKIMEDDITPGGCPGCPHRFRQSVIETVGSWVTDHDKCFHMALPNAVFASEWEPS